MSLYSNHEPEVVAACHDRAAADEEGWPDERWTTTEPTPENWAEYAAYLDSLPAGPEPDPDDLGEPQGQCFPEEPPW
jgi:hypothetical protein